MILDLGLGQRGLFHHRPHDRLGAAIELAGHGEFQELAGDHRLRPVGHGQIRVLEVALDAEAAELLGLHAHPMGGEVAAFLAELVDRHLVLVLALGPVLLLDLPLDRQAVAVPARHVIGVVAAHLERAGDDVLQHLVQGVADMEIAVGVGRPVMQHVFRPAGRFPAQGAVEVHRVPLADPFGLGLGQAGAHGKRRFGQEQRLGVVDPGGGTGRSVVLGVAHEFSHVVCRGRDGGARKGGVVAQMAGNPDLLRPGRSEGRATNSARTEYCAWIQHGVALATPRPDGKNAPPQGGRRRSRVKAQNAMRRSRSPSGATPASMARASSASRSIWAISASAPSKRSSPRRKPNSDTETVSP